MSSKKYYAVRKGKKPGIYNNWELCKKQIQGFSGAEYKGFSSYAEAEAFMNLDQSPNSLNKTDIMKTNKIDNNGIDVYVDGSYSEDLGVFSYACVFLDNDETILSGVGSEKTVLSMRNVAGELLASMEAIKWAVSSKYTHINIFYDYEGIEKWATGVWSANKEGTKQYVEFIEEYRNAISITFSKVRAHTGNKYNELADKIAKEAILKHTESRFQKNSIQVEDTNDILEYFHLFEKIVSKKDKSKNSFNFIIDNYEISESKLKKLAKELWATSGKDIKQISSINTKVFVTERIIICEVIDTSSSMSKYTIKF